MSNELVIDGISFAKKSESLQGKIALFRLERLRESIASTEGEIVFQLNGELDVQRRPSLKLSIVGAMQLTCQRCLTDFSHSLALESRFVLVASESDLPQVEDEDPEVDFIFVDRNLNVHELVEDEIILNLPLAPKHSVECVAICSKEGAMTATPFAKLLKPH